MARLPTVQIKTENGAVTINVADYDPNKHQIIGAPVEVEEKVEIDELYFDAMTVQELKDFAEKHEIELTRAKKKGEIIGVISAALLALELTIEEKEDKFLIVLGETLIIEQPFDTKEEAEAFLESLK